MNDATIEAVRSALTHAEMAADMDREELNSAKNRVDRLTHSLNKNEARVCELRSEVEGGK